MRGNPGAAFAAATMLTLAVIPAGAQGRDEAMREDFARRIEAADRVLDARKARGTAGLETALVSFSAHLPAARVGALLSSCACEAQQLHRTVGEMQMAMGVAPSLLKPGGETALALQFASHLEATLAAWEPPANDDSPAEKARKASERAALEALLAAARQGRAAFTGVLLRASVKDLASLRNHADGDVLAVEVLVGSARPFAITIDEYRRVMRR